MNPRGLASVRVKIGNVVLLIRCELASLIEELQKRYAGFTTDSASNISVKIKINQQAYATGLLNVKPTFTERLVVIDAPGYQGTIDLEGGVSEISLPAERLAEDTEYFLRLATALAIFHSGGLMFHAAGVASGKKVHLFFGHSGSGKTTIARNSPGKSVLNDDLVVLLREKGIWKGYSTPFWNPTQVKSINASGKIHALYQLVQDKQVALERIAPGIALAEFLANVPVVNADPGRAEELLERCQAVVTSVPVYHLHFLPDSTFWNVLKSG